MNEKQLFTFDLVYFDERGRTYRALKYHYETRWVFSKSMQRIPVMHDIVAHIRGLRDNGGPGALPGLRIEDGERWPNPILIAWAMDIQTTVLLAPENYGDPAPERKRVLHRRPGKPRA